MKVFAVLVLLAWSAPAQEITVSGTRFYIDGKHFPYTGVSFFNALYNAEFNRDAASRGKWLDKFRSYGINVLRVWGQWSMKGEFVDSCPACNMYELDGRLRAEPLARLKALATAAAERGMVIEYVFFSQEVVRRGEPLSEEAMEAAVRALTPEMGPYRNVTFQIWNEYDQHTMPLVMIIRELDPKRLVTNSPGFAGVLEGSPAQSRALDYLSPHTTRRVDGKTWAVASAEIRYLIEKYGKPVVDDEPGRNGTPLHGGPKDRTSPFDHIVHILDVRRAGGYSTYHHDMFQLGKGDPSVPPHGIPDPDFSHYHRVVFEFLKQGERYHTQP
jgi:hypothetical protein